jgi:transcriptional regulator with XRE-family HTH domain
VSQEGERGQLITQLRERKLWTREKLAKEADVSPTTVAQAEEGRTHIRLATIGKLSKALGVDPQELLHPKGNAPQSPDEDPLGRSPVLVEAMRATLAGWVRAVSDSQTDQKTAFGFVTAARDFEEQLNNYITHPEDYEQLSDQELQDIAQLTRLLERIGTMYRSTHIDAPSQRHALEAELRENTAAVEESKSPTDA